MQQIQFGGLKIEEFLQDYWQKQPLLLRQALPGYRCPISPEELAGLALEEDVVSRLVRESGTPQGWEVGYGPFREETFLALPEAHWTLLVQEVDRHVDLIAELLPLFNFLPRWRIDDIMVSYAADQGSVGPHVDQYDVFLLQGLGQRRWQVDQHSQDHTLVEGLELAILEHFQPTEEWLLQPGDMLYLPAGVPHHGVAQGPCMTLSIGCRAPNSVELLEGVLEQALLEPEYPRARYTDHLSRAITHSGLLDEAMRTELRQLLLQPLLDPSTLDRLIARYLSQPSRVQMHIFPEDELDWEAFCQTWRQRPVAIAQHLRALYFVTTKAIEVAIDGIDYNLALDLQEAVSQLIDQGQLSWPGESRAEALCPFLYATYEAGQLVFADA